ncbi:hypothetical protein ACVXG8_27515 [Escherichia coli]
MSSTCALTFIAAALVLRLTPRSSSVRPVRLHQFTIARASTLTPGAGALTAGSAAT